MFNEMHLSVILDLLKNGEINLDQATTAIARLAEQKYLMDSGDEARFQQLYREAGTSDYISNYHLPWTKEDIATLKKMRREGAKFDQIGRRLKRTERGVRSRWAFEILLEREAERISELEPTEE